MSLVPKKLAGPLSPETRGEYHELFETLTRKLAEASKRVVKIQEDVKNGQKVKKELERLEDEVKLSYQLASFTGLSLLGTSMPQLYKAASDRVSFYDMGASAANYPLEGHHPLITEPEALGWLRLNGWLSPNANLVMIGKLKSGREMPLVATINGTLESPLYSSIDLFDLTHTDKPVARLKLAYRMATTKNSLRFDDLHPSVEIVNESKRWMRIINLVTGEMIDTRIDSTDTTLDTSSSVGYIYTFKGEQYQLVAAIPSVPNPDPVWAAENVWPLREEPVAEWQRWTIGEGEDTLVMYARIIGSRRSGLLYDINEDSRFVYKDDKGDRTKFEKGLLTGKYPPKSFKPIDTFDFGFTRRIYTEQSNLVGVSQMYITMPSIDPSKIRLERLFTVYNSLRRSNWPSARPPFFLDLVPPSEIDSLLPFRNTTLYDSVQMPPAAVRYVYDRNSKKAPKNISWKDRAPNALYRLPPDEAKRVGHLYKDQPLENVSLETLEFEIETD